VTWCIIAQNLSGNDALGVVLPVHISFRGITVLKNVRKPAWLLGLLDTLYGTVLQSDRPKKTAKRLRYRKTGGQLRCASLH
jgi:hypothetical protein